MGMKRFGLAVRLQPDKIDEYRRNHQQVWPEVEARFRKVGFRELDLFLHGDTAFLFLIYDGPKSLLDALAHYADDPRIQEWEDLNARCKFVEDDATENGFSVLESIYQFSTLESRVD